MFEIEDADENDDVDQDFDSENATNTILVLPNGEKIKGTNDSAILWKWHKTAGCIGTQYILCTAQHCKGMEEVAKLPVRHSTVMPHCDACKRGKAHRTKASKKQPKHRYREVMYHMHTDTSGIIKTLTLSGAKYFAVFVDDASRYHFVALLKQKSDWLAAFDALTIRFGRHPKILRGDNAKEL